MNLEKVVTLLGHLQTLGDVVAQLPQQHREAVEGTFKANGLNLAAITRDAVRVKHSLQSIPCNAFEPLCALSTAHLCVSARSAIAQGETHGWGAVFYANEYGSFMNTNSSVWPQQSAPKCVVDAHRWARERGLGWIKFDADAVEVPDLPLYHDSDEPLVDAESLGGIAQAC